MCPGWFTDSTGNLSGGLYTDAAPIRVLDTRIGLDAPQAQLGPGQWLSVQVSGQPGLPASGMSAVVMNLTVTDPTQASYLEVNESGSFTTRAT